MKIRNGFVSNSSSSSFIAIGQMYERKELTEEEIENGHWIEGYNQYFIGEMFYIDDEIDSLSIEEINKIAKEQSERYNIPIEEIEVFYGSYYC